MLGRANPAVGLLSIGEEPEKGNAVTEAHQLLKRSGLNFIGNVEGRDLLGPERDAVDVVVCDGFVGNVVLKFYEAAAPFMIGLVTDRAPDIPSSSRCGLQAPRLLRVRRCAAARREGRDHHLPRRVSPGAIKNAVKVAAQAVGGMNDQIAADRRSARRPR